MYMIYEITGFIFCRYSVVFVQSTIYEKFHDIDILGYIPLNLCIPPLSMIRYKYQQIPDIYKVSPLYRNIFNENIINNTVLLYTVTIFLLCFLYGVK